MKIFTSTKTLFSMKTMPLFRSLMIAFASMPFVSLASVPGTAEMPKVIFEENKNQWPSQVLFKADIKGGALFLERNTFTYLLKEHIDWHGKHRNEANGVVKQKQHSFKVNFENSNPNSEIFGNNKYSWHRNYYLGNDKSKWASDVAVYSQAYYKDLYENIDLQYYNDDNYQLKYDLIVHPGGNPKNVKMNYAGTDGMDLNSNGHLFIKTTIFDIIEQKPYAYQVINGNKVQVPCEYVLKNNTVTFNVGEYDRSLPLIIDPTLIACTYTGSTADNWGYTATYDAAANIYIGGIISGTGYPTTVGAHDASYNGGTYQVGPPFLWPMDIFLAKFNPTGTALLYATYYGGLTNEQPHSIMVNTSNELYVVGRSNSANFPTLGAYDASINGGYDIIVGKFNSTGGLLASTFVGGSSDDCVNVTLDETSYGTTKFNYTDDGRSEIILDANSNVYIAANTKSANFPLVNPYQAAFGGTQDAVVIKMNSTLSALQWSTFLGGTGTDAAYGLKLDNSANVYVTGGTTGGGFPTTAGVLNPTYKGGLCDGFISVFNPSLSAGAQLLRSTFIGTTAYDQSYMIEIDASGDLYVYGQTQGAYPTTAGVYKNANSGQFIHKLTGSLAATVFSTTIGNGPAAGTPNVNISPTAFLVDSCQTIYIAGWARSSALGPMPNSSNCTGMPFTTNAIQPTTDGRDHYFMVLEPDAKGLFYATFFGENGGGSADHVDGGTCRFDKRGVIYQACCASCGGTNGFPVMPGAYGPNNLSNHINYPNPNSPNTSIFNCNEAVVKMDVAVNPIAKANITSATKGCAPFVVSFDNSGSNADDYIWDFGDGGTSTLPSPTYTYNFAGTFTITLFAIDSIGICGYIDTSEVVVTVGQYPTLITSATNILCAPGQGSALVNATGGITPYTYAWSPSGGNSSAATGLSAGNYTVTVTDNTGCTSTKSVTVTQPPVLTVSTATIGATCGIANGSATVTPTGGTPGYTYNWSSGQTTTSATGLSSGTYSITVTDANGCTTTQAFTIPVTNSPTITLTATQTISCNGGSNGAINASLTGGTLPYTYVWSPTSAGTNQTATGLSAGTYVVIITDATGCSTQGLMNLPEPSPIFVTVPSTGVLCYGGSSGTATANVSGGTPAYSYSWTPTGGSSGTANNLAAGNYTVTVTDANGCSKKGPVTISQPASALAMTTSNSGYSCSGSPNGVASVSVTPGTGTPSYTYNWSNGGTTPVISNIPSGTYTVTVTDANGCTQVSTATVPPSVLPVADFTFTPTISCEGISMKFTDMSTNALSWNWTATGGAGTSTSPNPTFVFPYNGSYNVTLIVANPPCKDTATKSVSVGGLGTGMKFTEANVFTPNNDGVNDCFHPAMINIATGLPDEVLLPCTYLEVFDRWGVKMYESLGVNGQNCWNGNNKNDSRPAPDGTYYWISKLGETTLKGFVTLARHK